MAVPKLPLLLSGFARNEPSNLKGKRIASLFCITVRLVGADEQFLGRVELLHRGMRGTVCSYSVSGAIEPTWNIQSANVVCRQLGFKDALGAPVCAPFGPGNGIIWLDQAICRGNESSLVECRHGVDWGQSFCNHGNDVGVVCRPLVTRGK